MDFRHHYGYEQHHHDYDENVRDFVNLRRVRVNEYESYRRHVCECARVQ